MDSVETQIIVYIGTQPAAVFTRPARADRRNTPAPSLTLRLASVQRRCLLATALFFTSWPASTSDPVEFKKNPFLSFVYIVKGTPVWNFSNLGPTVGDDELF